ncbi:hybrid sensor histidine kinase/response regulator [Candidatus Magnetomonas plexicatena]|uniref:hybrid sensor histidine kinase/response regulator n=1 Tax=Candidatus Magnetomonas plexicatena TaxID=2552947 RepID=UPI001C765D9A|nr:hybrid sensor histidine kinase/response regulator [Nitrospirales bacterium LBB_01]
MAFDRAKFINIFVEEAKEHITKITEGLSTLEKDPSDTENLNAIFRTAHTIKGSARMLKLAPIGEVAHKIEDILDAIKNSEIVVTRQIVSALYKGIDTISELVECAGAGQDISSSGTDVCALLEELLNMPEDSVDLVEKTPEHEQDTHTQAYQPVKAAETLRINADKLDTLIKLMGEIVTHQRQLKERVTEIKEVMRLSKIHSLKLDALSSEFPQLDSLSSDAAKINLRAKQLAAELTNDGNVQELLNETLQEVALTMRMVPLSTVFDSFGRTIRDASRALGKDINFTVAGGDTELDKKMVEKIADPLIHMIRNSLDHGIEESSVRRAAGKADIGEIALRAFYDSGNVVIDVADDGAGLAIEKIKNKALQRRLFDETALNAMSDAEVFDLIFYPGFSTASIITDVSGRGVGMDVVKKNIVDELKGTISIESKPGLGTRFTMRVPMTLAIMGVIVFETAGLVFALPKSAVVEIVKVPDTELVDVVMSKALRLREELIPVESLTKVLGLPDNGNGKHSEVLILVIKISDDKLGLIIDSIVEEENMVIKPFPKHMKNLQLVSGVTVSGKNEVINLLNVSGVIKAVRQGAGKTRAAVPVAKEHHAIKILVVDDSINTREIEKSILEAYGYEVDIAEDGIEALEKTGKQKYDVVITDVEMPRLDGFALTQTLRKDVNYAATPIIIVTSREKEVDRQRGIAVGADAYIVKGTFEQTTLLETIRSLAG